MFWCRSCNSTRCCGTGDVLIQGVVVLEDVEVVQGVVVLEMS